MVGTSATWEEKELGVILCETFKFMFKNKFKFSGALINTRDGGGIQYMNKLGTKRINFSFLPNYDITIEIDPPLVVMLLNFFSLIFFKRELRKSKYISLKSELSPNQKIIDFRTFIKQSLTYMKENNLV